LKGLETRSLSQGGFLTFKVRQEALERFASRRKIPIKLVDSNRQFSMSVIGCSPPSASALKVAWATH
jgi:hypothetical protein